MFPRPRRDLPAWLAAARADGADGHHRLIHKVDTWFDRHLVSQWAGARDAPDAVYDRLSREFTGGGVDALVVASGARHPMGRPRTAHPRRRPVVAGVARDAAPEALRDASSRPSGAFADPRPDGVFWSLMRDAAGQLYVGVMGGRAPSRAADASTPWLPRTEIDARTGRRQLSYRSGMIAVWVCR